MAWVFDGFEDVQVPDKKAVIPKPQSNTNNLILLGFGLLAGYLLFSDEKKEENKTVTQSLPIDDLDKKVANQIPHKSNPIIKTVIDNHPYINENEDKGGLTERGISQEQYDHIFPELPPVAPLEIKTLDDIKTYGRGLRNLFGKSVLPPMKDHEGNASPTALAAANLGCPIPKTKKEAKELARKGTEALRKYKELKKSGIKKNDSVDFKA